jgi:hypothetical protein
MRVIEDDLSGDKVAALLGEHREDSFSRFMTLEL